MKKMLVTIEQVKQSMETYLNIPVKIRVNRGRNKIYYYDCKIINLFSSVFQIEIEDENRTTQTYSYSGVLCGEIKFCKKNVEIK